MPFVLGFSHCFPLASWLACCCFCCQCCFSAKVYSSCTFCKLHSPYYYCYYFHHLRYSASLVLSSLLAVVLVGWLLFFMLISFSLHFRWSEELSYGFFPLLLPFSLYLIFSSNYSYTYTFSGAVICCRASSSSLGFWFALFFGCYFRFVYVCVFVRHSRSHILSPCEWVCVCVGARDIHGRYNNVLAVAMQPKSVPFKRSCQWKISG